MDQPSSPESNALTLRIKFKSASLDDFIGRYGVDVSPGGIFIRTKQPVDVGTTLQFDFSLVDGSSLLAGIGTVAWVRENDPSRANNVPGMGLRFDKLSPESQQVHQTILAEKARREGRPQGTPYPPTAFVVPASRPSPSPDAARAADGGAAPDALPKGEPAPVNLAKTMPAPASAVPVRAKDFVGGSNDADEFESGGKTEISDKPLDYYMREAQAHAGAGVVVAPDEAAPRSDIEEWKTDAHTEEGISAPPAPEEVSLTDSQAISTEIPAGSVESLDSGERRPSDKDFFTEMLDTGDTTESPADSPLRQTAPAEDGSGVPIEEAIPEKTEELSFMSAKIGDEDEAAPAEPVDLGVGGSAADEDEPVPSLGEIPYPETKKSGKRSSALMIGAVLFSGAAAFAAVYLFQTKPWQTTSEEQGEAPVVTKVSPPAAAPGPEPEKAIPAEPAKVAAAAAKTAEPQPAAGEAKPAGEEPPAAKAVKLTAAEKAAAAKAEKAAAAEQAAAEKAAAAKLAAEKAAAAKAEKAAAEKAAAEQAAAEKAAAAKLAAEKAAAAKAAKAEKAAAAKAAAEQAAAEKAAAAAAKAAAAKAARASKLAAKPAGAAGLEPPEEAKPAAASEQEEIYRLAFRSSPIGAEVLIDGEYYARTPCERRILDPKKNIAVTIRKEGYEPHERMIGSSDNWAKKEGGERVLSIIVVLKKLKPAEPAEPAAAAAPAAPAAVPAAGAAGGTGTGAAGKPPAAPDEPYKE